VCAWRAGRVRPPLTWQITRPLTKASGTGPYSRLSRDMIRLSPCSHMWPVGTWAVGGIVILGGGSGIRVLRRRRLSLRVSRAATGQAPQRQCRAGKIKHVYTQGKGLGWSAETPGVGMLWAGQR
jgi:hypothetical protein